MYIGYHIGYRRNITVVVLLITYDREHCSKIKFEWLDDFELFAIKR